MWVELRLWAKWLIVDTAKAISSLVFIIENMTELTMLWYFLISFLLTIF